MTRTDSHSILVILTRAAAICLVVLNLPKAIDMVRIGFADLGYLALLQPVILIALAAVVWLFADVLLRAALSGGSSAGFQSDIAPREWQYLAFSAIGLWFAVSGTVDLVWWLTTAARSDAVHGSVTDIGYFGHPENLGGLLATVFQITVGVALIFGSRGLIGLLRRLRDR